jgi:hypothetical protein
MEESLIPTAEKLLLYGEYSEYLGWVFVFPKEEEQDDDRQ